MMAGNKKEGYNGKLGRAWGKRGGGIGSFGSLFLRRFSDSYRELTEKIKNSLISLFFFVDQFSQAIWDLFAFTSPFLSIFCYFVSFCMFFTFLLNLRESASFPHF